MRIPGYLFAPCRTPHRLPRFLALTDAGRAPDPFAMLAHLPKDCGLVWRAYDGEISRARLQGLARAARRSHVPLFLGASGRYRAARLPVHLHLPEHRLNKPYTDGMFRRECRAYPQTIVTSAAHSQRAVIAAAHAGVDAILISPVFPTRSHPGGTSLGIVRFAPLARLARSLGLAVYALGGINDLSKIRRLVPSGATGIAGIDIFLTDDQA